MVADVWGDTIERVREAAESHLGKQFGDAEAALRAIDQTALIHEYNQEQGLTRLASTA